MQVEGGAPKMVRITSSNSLDYLPSGGQQSIAYTSIPRRAKSPQIWLCKPDGSEPSLITEGEAPQIAPAGDRILFTRRSNGAGGKPPVSQLWTMNINGVGETQLIQNKDFDIIDPKWDPDGKWIVYASNEGRDARGTRNFDIWLMTADGSQTIQLTSDGSDDTSPSFDRTGNYIYFRSNRGGYWNIWRCELTPEVRKQMSR
jgi:Tol biopolymer transport system component